MATVADNDNDSTFGSMASSTASLSSSILDYPDHHGRLYHAYKPGIYFLPNDTDEQTRLDIHREAVCLATGGELLHVPLDPVSRVLDLGTGTGQWAIDIADLYPSTIVIGVDISPIQPDWVPPNVIFQVFDVEDDWDWNEQFDLIRSNDMLMGSIGNKEKYFAQAFEYCKSGGYFELHEVDINVRSNGSRVADDIQEWCRLMKEGIREFGNKTLDLDSLNIPKLMREAGFTDIVCKKFKIPLGPWSNDPDLKVAGLLELFALCQGLGGLSLAIFTRFHKWPLDMLELFLAGVRQSLRTGDCLYMPCIVVYGRKPPEEDYKR